MRAEIERLDGVVGKQAAENERLMVALQFYAKEENYLQSGWQGDPEPEEVLKDGGKRARRELEGRKMRGYTLEQQIQNTIDEIDRLKAENERLRAAALPFAQHDWMDAELEDDNCQLARSSGSITVGHWRALRRALEGGE